MTKNRFISYIKHIHNAQKGSNVIFFAMFIIPVLSFLFMLAFDTASIYTKRKYAQRILDEATLQGVKFFPHRDYAKQITTNYLTSHSLEDKYFNVKVDANGIKVNYNRPYFLVFSNLANHFAGIKDPYTIMVSAFSFASPSVSDVLILLDRNSYNSPTSADDDKLWGSVGEYPSATYFSSAGLNDELARYSTQQCFNEVMISLKNILLETYNFYGSVELNSVGAGVFPSGDEGETKHEIYLIKDIDKANFSSTEAKFLPYSDNDGVASLSCYKAAINESQEEKYLFPKYDSEYNNNNDNLENTDAPNENGLSSILTSIWSAPVNKGEISDASSVLDHGLKYLISAKTRADRHTSSINVSKNLFILTSNIPSSISLSEEVKNVSKDINKKINVIYVLLESDKIKKNKTPQDFKNMLKTLNNDNDNIKFYLISSDNKDELSSNLQNFIWLNKKEGSIWR